MVLSKWIRERERPFLREEMWSFFFSRLGMDFESMDLIGLALGPFHFPHASR